MRIRRRTPRIVRPDPDRRRELEDALAPLEALTGHPHPDYRAAWHAMRGGDAGPGLALMAAARERDDHDRRWEIIHHVAAAVGDDTDAVDAHARAGHPDAHVLGAAAHLRRAWTAQPGAAAPSPARFRTGIAAARAALDAALDADRYDPLVYELLMHAHRGGTEGRAPLEALMSCAELADAHHYGWRREVARSLSPRWYGQGSEGWDASVAASYAAPLGSRARLVACEAARQELLHAQESDDGDPHEVLARVDLALGLARECAERSPDAGIRNHAWNWMALLYCQTGRAAPAHEAFRAVGVWCGSDPWVDAGMVARHRAWCLDELARERPAALPRAA